MELDCNDVHVVSAFISYAHGDVAHEHQVRRLYELLTAAGVDVILDTLHTGPGQDWKSWTRAKIEEVDYVLVVVSADYRDRADNPEEHPTDGHGVWWEADHLAGLMYNDRQAAYRKILPVLLPGASTDDLPRFFSKGRHVYVISVLSAAGVDPLVQAIRARPVESRGRAEPATGVRSEAEGRTRKGLRGLLPRPLRGRRAARSDAARAAGRVHEDIESLVARLGLPGGLGEDISPAGLRRLLSRLPDTEVEAAQLYSTVDGLLVSDATVRFVTAVLPRVDSAALRRSLRRADIPDDDETPFHDERELLTHLALRFPLVDGDCRRQMVRFIVALTADQGADLGGALVDEWADRIGAPRVLVNDARQALASRTLVERLRLVVSLLSADPNAVWPTAAMAWLEDDGNLVGPAEEQCRPEGHDVERAVVRLVDWGLAEARKLGIDLHNIEVAATTGLLMESWHPGSIRYLRRLADHFSVTVRWSERLRPSVAMARSIDYSIAQLRKIADQSGLPPVDWVDGDDLDDPALLSARLVDGVYERALGLPRRPVGGARVLRLALTHSPIVIWPHSMDWVSPAARAQLAAQWRRLPHAFQEQYVRRWRGLPTDDLAELRAVWDDERWLAFCAKFQYTP